MFLKQAVNGEDPVDQASELEEQYERMFPKIGRDFVHKDDLYRIMDLLMTFVDPLGLNPIDFDSDAGARKRALIYKDILDRGLDGSKVFRDLINLDDD